MISWREELSYDSGTNTGDIKSYDEKYENLGLLAEMEPIIEIQKYWGIPLLVTKTDRYISS